MELWCLVVFANIIQGAIIIAVVLNKNHFKLSKRDFIFSIAVVEAVLITVYAFLRIVDVIEDHYTLYAALGFARALLGPVVLLLTQSVILPNFTYRKSQLLYLTPGLIWLGFCIWHLMSPISLSENYTLFSIGNINFNYIKFENLTLFLMNSYFVIKAYIFYSKYRQSLEVVASNIEFLQFLWVKRMLQFLLVIMFLRIAFITTGQHELFSSVILIALSNAVFGMSFYTLPLGFKEAKLLHKFKSLKGDLIKIRKRDLLQELEEQLLKPQQKLTQGLDKQQLIELADKIAKTVQENQLYRNPNMHLGTLAKIMKIPSAQLAEVFDRKIGQSFYEFINQARIDAAKSILKDKESKKYFDIAYEVGYTSQKEFRDSFIRFAGQAPEKYFKRN